MKHLALFSLLLHIEVASATAVEQLITKLLLYNCHSKKMQCNLIQLQLIHFGQTLILVSQQLQKWDSENSLSRPLHMLYFSTQNN